MRIPFLSKSKQAQLPATALTFWRLIKVATMSFTFGALTASIAIAVLIFRWYSAPGTVMANPFLPVGNYKVLTATDKIGSERLFILQDSRRRIFMSRLPAEPTEEVSEELQVANFGGWTNKWKFAKVTLPPRPEPREVAQTESQTMYEANPPLKEAPYERPSRLHRLKK